MRTRKLVAAIATTIVLGACSSSSNSPRAVDSPPVNNDSGDPVTGVITATFAPSAGVVPFPTNLLLSGTTDLTLNIPVADPTDISNPAVAMNALDGFSTVARWATNFSTTINPSTVVPGSSVRLFEVALNQPGGAVVGVVRELTPGAEYVAVASGSTLAILPTAPLAELTTYMAVLTDDIQDNDGNDSTPDQQYFIAKRTDPLVDANGNSTDPLLDNATASALEPLRQLTNAQEFAAASMGIPREEIVLSWTATTQAVTPVLSAVRSVTGAGASAVGPTGLTTAALGLAGAANISVGTVEVPLLSGRTFGIESNCDTDRTMGSFSRCLCSAVRRIRAGSDIYKCHLRQSFPSREVHTDNSSACDHPQRCNRYHQATQWLAGNDFSAWYYR